MNFKTQIFAVLLTPALVLGVLAVTTGCGKVAQKATEVATEKVAEKAMEKAMTEKGGNAKVNIDSKSGAVKMSGTDEKGNKFEYNTGQNGDQLQMKQTGPNGEVTQVGAGAKIPDNFPKDVPIIDGLQLNAVQATPANNEFMVQGSTKSAAADVVKFYKDKTAVQGWKEQTSMNAGEMQTLSYEKENRTLSIMVMKDNDQTMVSISVGQ